MVQRRSTKIIAMIKWIRTSRLSIKKLSVIKQVHARLFVGVSQSQFFRVLVFLAINAHKMAPRTT